MIKINSASELKEFIKDIIQFGEKKANSFTLYAKFPGQAYNDSIDYGESPDSSSCDILDCYLDLLKGGFIPYYVTREHVILVDGKENTKVEKVLTYVPVSELECIYGVKPMKEDEFLEWRRGRNESIASK